MEDVKTYLLTKDGETPRLQGFSKLPSALSKMGWSAVLAPQDAESAEDLELITETDEMGMERTIVTVSEAKKAARLERERLAREAQEQEAAAKALAKQARKDKAKAFDAKTAKLSDVAEMVVAIAEELGLR